MKRSMKSLLALVLVAVLTLGNLSGLGPVVSRAADATIYKVTAAKTTVSKDGENLEVTVTGENLPEKLYYKRIYVGLDDFGEDFDYSADGSAIEVDATGDAETRTIVVPMPAASEYPTASGWKVAVDTNQYGTFTRKCKKITIDGLEASTPEITSVEVSKESVSAAGETVTVTVKGTALPSEVYCKLYYQWEMSGRLIDSAYGTGSLVALTGENSTEKTFEVAIPAESEPGTEIVGWKVAVCLSMNGTYTKSGAMSIATEETPEVDNKVLNVKVVDKDGNPVSGVPLVLEGESYNPDVKIGTTDDNGLLSYALKYEADDYKLKPVKDSGFNCENPAEIYIGTDTDTFESFVEEVNGEEYTGEVTLVVEKEEVKAEPVLTSIEAAKTSVSKDGETLTITVKGENLPDTLYYVLKYVADDGFGDTIDNTVNWSGNAVAATGTATEKTIEVPIPSTTTYPKALSWKVRVGLSSSTSDGTYKTTSEIAIDGLEVPVTPEIKTVEVSKESVSAAGETVTVTVKGTALPNEVYCKLYYQWEMSGRLIDSAYGTGSLVALTGENSTEKTFEVAIPAESEPGTEIVGWKVAVCLSMNGTYTKSGVISVSAEETPDVPVVPEVDKTELSAKITALAGLKAEDYTIASFKALQTAINEATKVFNNEEATEEEVAEALATLQTAEDGLIALADLPKAPESVKAVLSGGYDDVKVSWSKVKGADSYRVYYKKSTSTSYTLLTTTTKLSATKKNLADGVKYTFKVVPCYKDGNTTVAGFYSKTASVYTLKKLATPKVSKVNSKKVKVSWTNINGESGYQISRSTKKTGTNIVSTYSTTSGKTKTLSVTKGKKYYYKVRAYKTVDGKKIYGPWSNVKAYTLK